MDLAIGIAAALAATAIFTVSVALQALESRSVSHEHAMRASLLTTLARSRRWLAAVGLLVVGWLFFVLALGFAPLTVVQPVRAVGLPLLLFVGVRFLGERAGPREYLGVAAIVAGVAALGVAAPDHNPHHASAGPLAVALAVVGAAAILPFVLRGRLLAASIAIVFASGLAYSWTDFVSKLVSDAVSGRAPLAAWGWATGVGVFAVLGLLAENSSFQRRPATQVVPIVFALQMMVPAVLAALVGGEDWGETPLGGAVIVAALAVVTAGTLVLAGSKAVADVVAVAEAAPERAEAAA